MAKKLDHLAGRLLSDRSIHPLPRILHAVDITEDCRTVPEETERIVLIYADGPEGMIVKCERWYPGEESGTGVTNRIEQLRTQLGQHSTAVFCRDARWYGMDPRELLALVMANAPKATSEAAA